MPPRAVCPLVFPCPVLRSPAFPTSQLNREILPIAGQQNKRAIAEANQQWVARACPPKFGSNHGLVWLMISYSRDQQTSVPVRVGSPVRLPPGPGRSLRVAVRVEPGNAKPPTPGSIGELKWDSGSGTYFGVDPKLDMVNGLMEQTHLERGRITPAFKALVYDAFEK